MMTALLHLGAVRAIRAWTAEKVFKAVDDGSLLWVFDFTPAVSRRRTLRFLACEIADPQKAASLTLRVVIDSILPPTRRSFGTTEIRGLFTLGRATGWRLAKTLGKRNSAGHWRVQREALARFLRERWIGGAQ